MTVVFTAVIAKLIATNPENGMAMAFTVVVLAGIFQIIFGLLRLGKYVTLMPYSVVSGFMSGIGIILIILQIGPLLGQPTPSGGVLSVLENLGNLISGMKLSEIMLGGITLAILFLTPTRLARVLPPPLMALVVGTLLSVMFLSIDDIRRIGEIPSGLPSFQMPVFSIAEWQLMLVDAIVLGMLGSIDALLTSVIADSLTRTQHKSDKELIGQGIGNMASGFFGGLPGAGATMGTVVNIQTGARSALSGLVRAGILLVIVLWASGLTAFIPLAVLAGIAFKVGVNIIEWNFLKRAHRLSAKGAVITYGVILLTVFVDLIVAVGLGLFIANVMTITRLSEFQEDDVKAISPSNDVDNELTAYEKDLMESDPDKVFLLRLKGTMIFGVSRAISRRNSSLHGCDSLIMDLTQVKHLGVSSALAVEEAIRDMLQAGKNVYIVGANGQPLDRLTKLGVKRCVPDKNWLDNRRVALEKAIYGGEQNADATVEADADSGQHQS